MARLVKEFPFIAEERNLDHCEHIVIKRADERVMESTPTAVNILGPSVSIVEGDCVTLFDKDGNALANVKPRLYQIDYSDGGRESGHPGETLLECIFGLDLVDLIHYALWVRFGYDVLNNESQPTWRATLYKPGHDPTIEEMITGAYRHADVEVSIASVV